MPRKWRPWHPSDGLQRHGECIQCGRCCASQINVCPHFSWKALEDIPVDTLIQVTGRGTALIGVCLISGTRRRWRYCTLRTRRNFPSDPRQIEGKCGYYFTTKHGKPIKVKSEGNRRVLMVAT